MKLLTLFNEFEKSFIEFEEEFKKILEIDIINEEQFNAVTNIFDDTSRNFNKFLIINVSEDLLKRLEDLIYRSLNDRFYSFADLDYRKEDLFKEIKYKIFNIKSILNLIKISDSLMLNTSFIEERFDLTIEEKKEILLDKLYHLRKHDTYWSVNRIFWLNEVHMDSEEEAEQIASQLQRTGLVTSENSYNNWNIKISAKGKQTIERKILSAKPKIKEHNKNSLMDIFISHSSQDIETAKLLIDLINSSLKIPAKRIRCTSVDGYRLPAGASTEQQLKNEVNDCKVLLGLISHNSINSAYVLFELGARWGQSKPLVPLVTNKKGNELLKGPLSGINALNTSVAAQLHQLISDLANMLKIKSELPAVYQEKIDALVQYSLKETIAV
ncbi:toll/interleukin-1 receptor domain-containing protein [Pedobacter alpinus]|uniref:Toll/interleukin-1 receptor domain-containing protein n=1 Tax=Pedobacter alpinus TaxID=1590643 RepID=A0ABW5TQ98_9SPHI